MAAADLIEIRTSKGEIVQVSPDEIVPKRMGVLVKQRRILLEYLVPKHGVIAHHPITVSTPFADDPASASAEFVAKRLWEVHRAWLGGVDVDQLTEFVSRLGIGEATPRVAAKREDEVLRPPARVSKRPRLEISPVNARATKFSREPDIRKTFDAIKGEEDEEDTLTLEQLYVYMVDYSGYGSSEAEQLFKFTSGDDRTGVSFEKFTKFYPRLSPFIIGGKGPPSPQAEVFMRKAGALGGFHKTYTVQPCNLEELQDCEVYVATPCAQAFVDECKRCIIMYAPLESSFFIRDCEDCVVWVAAQQLRTRNCKRCTFFLYSKTEPIIEASEDLSFAPWCASYPGCSKHFEMFNFNPKKNLWNNLFDFTGKQGSANWRIMGMHEITELTLVLDEDVPWGGGREPDNPVPPVTHEVLCAYPLSSDGDCGQGVANIPQTRPKMPAAPPADLKVDKITVFDHAHPKGKVGATRLKYFKPQVGC